MQQVFNVQSSALSQLSNDVLQSMTDISRSTLSTWTKNPWGFSPWMQMLDDGLSSAKKLTGANQSALKALLSYTDTDCAQRIGVCAQSLSELAAITADFGQAVTTANTDVFKGNADVWTHHLDTCSQVRSLSEALSAQADLHKQWQTTVANQTTEAFNLLSTLHTALLAWSENTMSRLGPPPASSAEAQAISTDVSSPAEPVESVRATTVEAAPLATPSTKSLARQKRSAAE